MTIATKPAEKVADSGDAKKQDVDTAVPPADHTEVNFAFIGPPDGAWRFEQRRRLMKMFCVGLLFVWLLLAVCVSGMLLLRYLRIHHRMVAGFCRARGHQLPGGEFQQRVFIDQDSDYETIDTPRYADMRGATFLHDFLNNITVIRDTGDSECFVKPLEEGVMKPKSMADLINKFQNNYYEDSVRMTFVRYRALIPPMSYGDLIGLGSPMAYSMCREFDTYWLVRSDTDDTGLPLVEAVGQAAKNVTSGGGAVERVKRSAGNSKSFGEMLSGRGEIEKIEIVKA